MSIHVLSATNDSEREDFLVAGEKQADKKNSERLKCKRKSSA